MRLLLSAFAIASIAADRPNVLWVTCEDMGPNLGCFGDAYATTPNLDAFAEKSTRYTACWSNAPVCAPARTTIITGMYPTSLGAEHMRSLVPMPKGMKLFPQYLREAGYYCTNNVKEDYNVEKPAPQEGQPRGGRVVDLVWDESSNKAHYRNRKKGQPFFAVFNITTTHESQLRTRPHKQVHDPAKVVVPPYHPDSPEVRQDWAQYYDKITEMDRQVGKILKDLEVDGLADETVVFFFSDHGSGMPRHKRSPQNSGLRVPMIVHFPKNWRTIAPKGYAAGTATDRLVSFVDLAPTVLSLIGVEPPTTMQGVPFLGKYAGEARKYAHGFRGRMDERIDCIRSVFDGRFVYVRNFLPHVPKGQHVGYMFQTPTTLVWKRLFDAGKLNDVQAAFFRPKAPEELYDLAHDPSETVNLAGSPPHKAVLERMRKELRDQAVRVRDVGLLPEAEMQRRAGAASPYDFGHSESYPVTRVLAAAEAASDGAAGKPDDEEPGVRYWAAMGHRIRGEPAPKRMLDDKVPAVAVAAAESLTLSKDPADRDRAMNVLLEHADPLAYGAFLPVQALNAMDPFRDRAEFLAAVKKLPDKAADVPARSNEYVGRLKAYYLGIKLKN